MKQGKQFLALLALGAIWGAASWSSEPRISIRPWKGPGTWKLDPALFENQPAKTGSVPEDGRPSWYQRATLDAYERYGHRSSAWDDLARAALDVSEKRWSGSSNVTEKARLDACIKAVDAGCNDPSILYYYALSRTRVEEVGEAEERGLFAAAAEALAGSSYPPLLKCWSFLLAAHQQKAPHGGRTETQSQNMKILIDAAFDLIPLVAHEPGIPCRDLMDVCDEYIKVYRDRYGNVEPGFEALVAALRQTLPPSNPLPDILAGDHLLEQAWKARGGGYANTVTGHGWDLYEERHAKAEAAYRRAWESDPTNSRLARRMIRVTAENGEREEMEQWFQRAMNLDPDYGDACSTKLFFLTPKWGGSEAEMLAFGRACYDTGNWKARLPFILVDAHDQLAGSLNYPEKHSYFLRPGVWEDIERVYRPYLLNHPDATLDRSRYAWFAAVTHRWKLADEQFTILGDRVWVRVFGNRERLDQVREEARVRATEPASTGDAILSPELVRAITEGDLDRVTIWLDTGGDVQSVDEMGESALAVAVAANQAEIALLLIQRGGDVQARNLSNRSILMTALGKNHVQMAILLIEKGADVLVRNDQGENIAMKTALEHRLVEVVESLLDHGVKPNAKNKKQNTLLHMAAERGYPEMVNLLVERGADPEARNSYQYTPLMTACAAHKAESAEALLDRGAQVDARTTANTTALLISAYRGHSDMVEMLLDRGADINVIYEKEGRTPIMCAAEGGHIDAVHVFLERGANLDIRDKHGLTALDIARERGHADVAALLESFARN